MMKISCQTAASYIAKAQETRLTQKERIALQVHLGLCSMCKTYELQVRGIMRLFQTNSQNLPGRLTFRQKEHMRQTVQQQLQ